MITGWRGRLIRWAAELADAENLVYGGGTFQKWGCRSRVSPVSQQGRMAPEGVAYISSWVDEKFERCYQVMETHDRRLLDEWMENWSDLVDFEVHVVVSSREAAEKIAPRL